MWVDPVTTKQWRGIFDPNGLFVKLDAVVVPVTSQAMAPGHAYQITPPAADGSFTVLTDLGSRTALGDIATAVAVSSVVNALATTPTVSTSTSNAPRPAENVMYVDNNGRQWAGYLQNNQFEKVEPLGKWRPGLKKGHAYRMGPAPNFAVGADLGAKTAAGPSTSGGPFDLGAIAQTVGSVASSQPGQSVLGGLLSKIPGMSKSAPKAPARPAAPPGGLGGAVPSAPSGMALENVLYVSPAPTPNPQGELVYAMAGNITNGVFNGLEPAAYLSINGQIASAIGQPPPGLTPGHYYQLGPAPSFAVGADLGSTIAGASLGSAIGSAIGGAVPGSALGSAVPVSSNPDAESDTTAAGPRRRAGGLTSALSGLTSALSGSADASTAPTVENAVFVATTPMQLPGAGSSAGAQVYAWTGNLSPAPSGAGSVFTALEPAALLVVNGQPTTAFNQGPVGLLPGHYYPLSTDGSFTVGADLGTAATANITGGAPKSAGGPVDDIDTATIAIVGVGSVLALGLAGYAAYKAWEPKEEEYSVLPEPRY